MADLITAVQDRLSLTLTEVKLVLGASDAEDHRLSLLVPAALEAADQYMHNAFQDSSGANINIPFLVKVGCIEWISAFRQSTGTGDVKREKAGDVEREYHDNNNDELVPAGVRKFWDPWRLEVGF